MPARKPSSLSQRHDLPVDKAARAAAEAAMTPRTALTARAPDELKGHPRAAAVWKRTLTLYGETEAKIVTGFDQDLIVKYCLLEEECIELAALRKEIKKDYDDQRKEAKKFKPKADQIKDYVNMWAVVNALFQRFQGMDARLDGKRKLLHTMAQSLYLTPRARAGVAPTEKEPEQPKSEMEEILDG